MISRMYYYRPSFLRPRKAAGWAIKWDAMRIDVIRDGVIFFCKHKTEPQFLPNQIRAAIAAGAEQRIFLKVDARARYGDVKVVLAEI